MESNRFPFVLLPMTKAERRRIPLYNPYPDITFSCIPPYLPINQEFSLHYIVGAYDIDQLSSWKEIHVPSANFDFVRCGHVGDRSEAL